MPHKFFTDFSWVHRPAFAHARVLDYLCNRHTYRQTYYTQTFNPKGTDRLSREKQTVGLCRQAGERPGNLSSFKDRSITTKCSSSTPEGPECARAHPRDLAVRKPDIIVIIHLSLITTEGKARSVCFELLTVSSPYRRLRTWRKQTLPSVSVLRLTEKVFLPRLLFSGRTRVEAGPGVFWQLFYSLRLL